MDRQAWLRERRQTAEERHDAIHAFTYDDQYGEIGPTHRRFVADLLERCPPGGAVLDAACGTGKYFAMVLDSGRRVVGTDQSTGMLARARARFPAVPLERVGLQELAFDAEFDAVMCVDAMENIPPEDWPRVVANLSRAVRPGGPVYLTVEQVDDRELDRELADATARGLPVVRGEASRESYHFYPSRGQVDRWLEKAGWPWRRRSTAKGRATATCTCCWPRPAAGRARGRARRGAPPARGSRCTAGGPTAQRLVTRATSRPSACGWLAAAQPAPPRSAMLRAAFQSACPAKPHDRQPKVAWSWRLARSTCPQPEQLCEVCAGFTWMTTTPARSAL